MKNSGIEWIGEIPDSWEVNLVKNIFDITRGRVIAKNEIEDEPLEGYYPVYSSQTANSGILGYIPSYDFAIDSLTWTTDGAKAGTVFLRRGKYSITNVCGILTLKSEKYSLDYLNYAVGFSAYNCRRADINGYKIMSNEMAIIPIVVPSLEDQQRIAQRLDEKCGKIDELITNQEKQIEKLKEYKQSVITEAVTKGLDKSAPMKNSGIEWIGKIPCHWTNPKIKYYCKVESGATPERTHSEYWNGNINWFKTGELQNNVVFESEEKITDIAIRKSSVKIFPEDTILVAMYGQGKTRGMTALLKTASTTNQACAGILLRKEGFDVFYLWWVLRGAYDSLRQLANGSGQPNLSGALISDFLITKPPIQEQKNIVSYLDNKCGKIDRLIAIKQEKIEKLQEYKKSLIYEYVTGKKEVV